jgi:hypothetical protein
MGFGSAMMIPFGLPLKRQGKLALQPLQFVTSCLVIFPKKFQRQVARTCPSTDRFWSAVLFEGAAGSAPSLENETVGSRLWDNPVDVLRVKHEGLS